MGFFLAEFASRLRDLVQLSRCGACGGDTAAAARALCDPCLRRIRSLEPVVAAPSLPATPVCAAAGHYAGVLRDCLLAFKEHGRRDLLPELGTLLAAVVDRCVDGPVTLVPIPATAKARRERGFDHVVALCRHACTRLPRARMARLLRAAPRPDSTHLSVSDRAAAARSSLRMRNKLWPAGDVQILLVDDIVTSGATLAAASGALEGAGVQVLGAVAVAATVRTKIHP